MRAGFERVTGLDDVIRHAAELSARTLVFDVEPLVAYWDGGQEALDEGIARVLGEIAVLPAVRVVCFATNSLRRPSVVPIRAAVQVVIGDQVATDGILARRLGYAFLLFDPQLTGVPPGPRLMGAWGRLVRPLLFTRDGGRVITGTPSNS